MKKAIILAAGTGSRLSALTGTQPKCLIDLGGICSLDYILRCLSENSVNNALIVIGYKSEQIIKHFGSEKYHVKIDYIFNKFFDYHGCGYSLALSEIMLNQTDTVIITEADLLIPPGNFSLLINNPYENAALIRPGEINKERSVVALGDDNLVTEFVYDTTHTDVFRFIKKKIIGESLQLWKFSGAAAKKFIDALAGFKNEISSEPDLRSGIFSINSVIKDYPMYPVMIQGNEWINLNTADDVEMAKKLLWLKK
jgi:NDP-sugar pyrophosphorylase family protein